MSKAAADAWIDSRLTMLVGKLNDRHTAVGARRWPQVLLTHTEKAIPADGASVVPDALSRKTTDNDDGWEKLGIAIGGAWPCALEINNYGSSKRQGYEVAVYVREDGKLFRRVPIQEGPETWREHPWRELPIDDLSQRTV